MVKVRKSHPQQKKINTKHVVTLAFIFLFASVGLWFIRHSLAAGIQALYDSIN